MTRLITIISICFLIVLKGICGTFLDRFDEGKLNADNWTVIADSNGTATVEDGKLNIVGGALGNWNITGVRFNQTVNISVEKLVMAVNGFLQRIKRISCAPQIRLIRYHNPLTARPKETLGTLRVTGLGLLWIKCGSGNPTLKVLRLASSRYSNSQLTRPNGTILMWR